MGADRRFRRYRRRRDPRDLAVVFDATAPDLLRVARFLAPDDGAAEDLVQATFLAAIEDADRWDPRRPLLPWLLGILQHRSRHLRARRRRDAAHVPDAEPTEDPADAAARREERQACRRAVAALPPLYREVVVLHYEHGLTCAEIGRALDRPAGTVRTQVVRGLDLLRRSLPLGLTTTAAFVTAPAVAAAGLHRIRAELLHRTAELAPTAASPLPALLGGMLVSKSLVLGAVLAGLSAAALLLLAADPQGDRATAGGHPVAAPEAAAAARPTRTTDARPEPRQALAAAPTAAAAATGTLVVRVRLAGREGRAAHDVGVQLQAPDAGLRPAADARTDGAGQAVFAALRQGVYRVVLDRADASADVAVAGGATASVELEVPPGLTLRGTVVDARGAPVRGAEVWGRRAAGSELGHRLAVTGAAGRFEVPETASGITVWARLAHFEPSAATMATGAVGGVIEVTLPLAAAAPRVTGTVVDGAGRPVPDALVALFAHAHDAIERRRAVAVWTGGDGRFVTDEVAPGRHLVAARDARRPARGCAVAEAQFDARGAHLELRLAPGARVAGTAREAGTGAPRARVPVRARHGLTLVPVAFGFEAAEAVTGADGTYRIEHLLPGPYHLVCGYRGERCAQRVELGPGADHRWDPVLATTQDLALRLLFHDGRPAARWRVQVAPAASPLDAREATTDAAGRARFRRAQAGRCAVAVYAGTAWRPFPDQRFEAVDLGAGEAVLVLDAGAGARCSIRGRLQDGAGRPLGVATIAVRRHGCDVSTRHYADPETGAFTVDDLPVGDYRLRVAPSGFPVREVRPPRAAGVVDLGTLVFARPGRFEWHLRSPAGAPVSGARVHLTGPGDARAEAEGTEGVYAAPGLAPGSWRATAVGPGFAPAVVTFAVGAGATETRRTRIEPARTVRLRVRFPDHPDRSGFAFCRLEVRAAGGAAPVWRELVVRPFDDTSARSIVVGLGLAPGDYEVAAQDAVLPWRGARTFAVTGGDERPLEVEFTVGPERTHR